MMLRVLILADLAVFFVCGVFMHLRYTPDLPRLLYAFGWLIVALLGATFATVAANVATNEPTTPGLVVGAVLMSGIAAGAVILTGVAVVRALRGEE